MSCTLCGGIGALEFETGWLCLECIGAKKPVTAPARLTCTVGPKNCWLPDGRGRAEDGRVVIRIDGKKTYLYTAVYRALMGEPPEGLTPDHTCLDPACVNPTHIEWVTREENASRSWTRGKRGNT